MCLLCGETLTNHMTTAGKRHIPFVICLQLLESEIINGCVNEECAMNALCSKLRQSSHAAAAEATLLLFAVPVICSH